MKAIFSAAAMLISLLLSGCASRPPLATVPSVDLNRYAGRWYEVAKYPNFFQRNCAGNTTAEYSARPDGSIGVVNESIGKNGKPMRVAGTATVVPGSGNAKLNVRFGGPISGAYWVIGLDEKNYSWAVVGHPSRQFLWILSREPKLPAATYQQILTLVAERGYDTARLEPTPQK
ncbi:MAG: lipocalin family protein [Verrucomicrobia bacterium]|nr:lipocalin family protein [Verrucomicrobiota bacterium]